MDRVLLEEIRTAVVAPLVIVLSVLGGVVIAWRTVSISTGLLLTALAAGLLAAAGVGAVRARAAATAVERVHTAQLQRVVEAATAVDKLVAWSAEELCRGGKVALPESLPAFEEAGAADEAVALLAELQVQAVAALMRVHDESQSAVLLSMLHQFAKREHALVARALEKLDLLQEGTEDPDQLEVLFTLDHLVTRLRRWVESKAVVAGESLRSAREPVSVMQVLRGANQEILHYARVTVAASTVGAELGLPRHVGPDLTHLLAELVRNATQFSDPATKVQVRAQQVARGLAIEIEDRVALPMRPDDRARWNRLLAEPDQVDVGALVSAGRLGLLTAARIARRHRISVQLTENPTGGTTALVVVPDRLLVSLALPVAAVAHPAPPAVPPTIQPARATPRSAPASASTAGQAASVPPLPRRVVTEQTEVPEPARPKPPAARPRYGLAGAFKDGVDAVRAQGRTLSAGPEPTGTVPPTSQP
ncbi:ATP-binding protein [Streptomyces sp. GbtcB6]|uniref:ATP-binding protein n=1 Tax=Streptomyces sp. GbtcB6 TaxID=2824751 RepID=UPI001C2F523A|nr:ATP-binding protein [Streptomyces sp. GbtcB6]